MTAETRAAMAAAIVGMRREGGGGEGGGGEGGGGERREQTSWSELLGLRRLSKD